MIGLIASIMSGIALGEPVFLLATIPYGIRFRYRNLSLISFYVYILLLIVQLPGGSLYEWLGFKTLILASIPTFLLLDEILRGVKTNREELMISGILVVLALSDYSLVAGLVAVMIYTTYRNFGKTAWYLYGWMILVAVVFYAVKNRLHDPVSQAFVIIGLSLLPMILAERKEVKFMEVGILEEK